jgi:hypothetical protein
VSGVGGLGQRSYWDMRIDYNYEGVQFGILERPDNFNHLHPPKYIMIGSVRYNLEEQRSAQHREDYEPGGRFENLRGVLEH